VIYDCGAEDGEGGGRFESFAGDFELTACLDELGWVLIERVSLVVKAIKKT